jgi:hypothetical protein
MRSVLILSLILSPLALATGCTHDDHDDDVVRSDTKTKVTTDSDGDRKVTKTEKKTTVDND